MNNDTSISPRSSGLGLRTKLVLGVVGLLAILLAVGVESITLLDQPRELAAEASRRMAKRRFPASLAALRAST